MNERPSLKKLQTFVGARDYDLSRDFYLALGWTIAFEEPEIAGLQLGDQGFYLQRYYQKDWCHNSMLHATVSDAQAWYEHIAGVLKEKSYGEARVDPPKDQSYGARVTFMWDPSGVLWHLAQPIS